MSFLDTIPAEIAEALGAELRDGTLKIGTLTSDGEGGFTTVYVDHPVKGLRVEYELEYRVRTGIPATDVQIIVLREGVTAAPSTDSLITIQGATYSIISIATDPADATWTLQARPIP
jgi:hypothetical protein